jgi:hypothetical protein
MDQDDVSTVQVVTGLTPFQLLIEAGRETQLAQSGIFSAPPLFPAMSLTDMWVHFSILSE